MSFTEAAIKTKEAKEAIGEGVLTLFKTNNLDSAVDAMVAKGKQNGALLTVKTGFVLDVLKALSEL